MEKTKLFIAVAFAITTSVSFAQNVWDGTSVPTATGNGIVTIGTSNASSTVTTPTTKLVIQEDNPFIELKDNTGTNAGPLAGNVGGTVGIKLTIPYQSSSYTIKADYNTVYGRHFSIYGPSGPGIAMTSNALYLGGMGVNTGGNIVITDYASFSNFVDFNGTVRIGSVSLPTSNQFKLVVGTGIITEKIKVATAGSANWSWPDFVFSKNHNLISLDSVETFIKENNHLPSIPSEREIKENGVDLLEMDAKLLQKIEEMTLYMIEMKKEIEFLKKKNQKLEEQLLK